MSWVFSLAYASVCAYAYAYAYALVKTSLNAAGGLLRPFRHQIHAKTKMLYAII